MPSVETVPQKQTHSVVIHAVVFAFSLIMTQSNIVSASVDQTIPVMLGGNAVLKCPSQKTPAPEIVWMGPKNEIIATRGVLSSSLPDKAKYLIIPGSGSGTAASSLIINDLGLNDDGVYLCRDADSRDELQSVNVTVLVSVQSIKLIAPKTSINEGSKVTVTCVTDGSKPAPEIVWIKQESDVSITPTRISGVNKDVVHSNGTVQRTSSLTLQVDRTDHRSLYTCRATVSVFSREDVWNPDVYLTPMSPWLQSKHVKYTDGDTAHFQCVTSGSKPVARVTWSLNSQPVSALSGKVSTQNREDTDGTFSTSSVLDVGVSRDLNGADVICSVTNRVLAFLGQGPRNASVSIVVEYAPVVTMTSSASEVKEGEDVTFTCSTDSEPAIDNDDVFLAMNEKFVPEWRIRRNGDQFSLSNVSRSDRGQYQCVARNSRGTGSSAPATLHVTFAPVCTYGDVRYIYVSLGSVIMIPCPIAAFPHDATITWVRRSTNQTLHRETAIRWTAEDMVENEMRYTPRAYEDIVCYAQNSKGESSRPCVWKLIPPKPPSPPQSCLVLRLPNASRQVLCAPGENGGSPQAFFLRVRTSSVQNDTVFPAVEPRFILDDLNSDADYNLTVCAISKSFPDRPVCAETLLFHTEPPLSPASSASVGNERLLYIILGIVFGSCVLLAVVFVIIVCRRRKGGNSVWNPEGRQEEESGRRRTSNQVDKEHTAMHEETDVHGCSSIEDGVNAREAATADNALLGRRSSTLVEQDEGTAVEGGRRLSQRSSSRSLSLPDKIRFQANTKVYVKMPEKDNNKLHEGEDGEEKGIPPDDLDNGVNFLRDEKGKDVDQHRFQYVNIDDKKAVESSQNADDRRNSRGRGTTQTQSDIDQHRSRYVNIDDKEEAEPPESEDDRRKSHGKVKTQTQSDDSGVMIGAADVRQNCSRSPSTNPTTQYRISDPADHKSFTEMIRLTLKKNRSSLLPKDPRKPNHEPPPPSPPSSFGASLMGTSYSPYHLCSPSALSASQTSLVSDKHREPSDIYDVPKSSSDWQRAMSLLSLSAIGSGVLGPDSPRREDYMDMTKDWKGGSVPNLDQIGRDADRGGRESGNEGNYFLMPSNKHAYLNVKYPDYRREGEGLRPHVRQPENASVIVRRDLINQQPDIQNGEKPNKQERKPRRWSSSEQKTLEMPSYPPGTETLRPPRPYQQAGLSRFEPTQSSMKLSPAPRLKLRAEDHPNLYPQERQGWYHKKGDVQKSHGGTSTFVPTHRAKHPNDSPSYMDMGGNISGFSKAMNTNLPNTDVSSRHGPRQRTSTPNDNTSYVKMEIHPETPGSIFSFDAVTAENGLDRKRKGEEGHQRGNVTDSMQHPHKLDPRPRLPSSVHRSPSYTMAVDSRGTTSSKVGKGDPLALSGGDAKGIGNPREATVNEREKGGHFRWLPVSNEDYVMIPTSSPSETSFENCPAASRQSYC